jgi:hypothetical protein
MNLLLSSYKSLMQKLKQTKLLYLKKAIILFAKVGNVAFTISILVKHKFHYNYLFLIIIIIIYTLNEL